MRLIERWCRSRDLGRCHPPGLARLAGQAPNAMQSTTRPSSPYEPDTLSGKFVA
jgi:hypothetical protein